VERVTRLLTSYRVNEGGDTLAGAVVSPALTMIDWEATAVFDGGGSLDDEESRPVRFVFVVLKAELVSGANMSAGGPERNHRDDDSAGRMPLGWARMYAMVFEFLAFVGGLGYAGWWLDGRHGWEPWGVLLGLMAGTALGLWRMIREAKRMGL